MSLFTTIIIKGKNEDVEKKVLHELHNQEYNFWLMYKKDGIRLRVKKDDEDEIFKICEQYELSKRIKIIYEPELNLFGGQEIIEDVHSVFCEARKVAHVLSQNNKNDLATLIFILVEIVKMGELDYFEEWDIWKKVSKHRKIINVEDMNTVLKQLPQLHSIMICNSNMYQEILDSYVKDSMLIINDNIKHIKNTCYNENVNRGFRGILSSIIIFVMNIFKIPASYQIGIINGITILKNPDFRREIFDDVY